MITEALIGAAAAGIVGIIGALYKRNQNKQDQYSHEENLVKLSKGISESNKILKDFTSLSRDMEYVKKGMNELHKEIKEIKQEVGVVKRTNTDTNLMLLAREICSIYASYSATQEIPEREFESTLNLFDVYNSLGGIGLIKTYVEEIKTWRRI